MTVAIIVGDLIAVMIYVSAFVLGKAIRVSSNPVYDFFMGIFLNPRVGSLDIKMWAEIRVSWTILFFLTVSAAVKQFEVYGVVTTPMCFMILAHGLYTNAC
jgi:delta24(24(1))-sterol reductase